MQCQQTIRDVAAKLNAERRDRDQDMDQVGEGPIEAQSHRDLIKRN